MSPLSGSICPVGLAPPTSALAPQVSCAMIMGKACGELKSALDSVPRRIRPLQEGKRNPRKVPALLPSAGPRAGLKQEAQLVGSWPSADPSSLREDPDAGGLRCKLSGDSRSCDGRASSLGSPSSVKSGCLVFGKLLHNKLTGRQGGSALSLTGRRGQGWRCAWVTSGSVCRKLFPSAPAFLSV